MSFEKLIDLEKSSCPDVPAPKVIQLAAFQKFCGQIGFAKAIPNADLTFVFLFLGTASGKPSKGYLTKSEWCLLKGFDSRALCGSPARLRRILEEHYQDLDTAFQTMHTSWVKQALSDGVKQVALAGLARALCEENVRPDAGTRSRGLAALRTPSSANQKPLTAKAGRTCDLPRLVASRSDPDIRNGLSNRPNSSMTQQARTKFL